MVAGSRKDYLSTQQAAAFCGVDRRTVLRWVSQGLLPSFQTGGGRNRIGRTDLIAFMRERGMPIPAGLAGVVPVSVTEMPPEVTGDDARARVLLVDDDTNHLVAMRRLVSFLHPGVEVREATDGFSAGLVVQAFRPHVLCLDVVMPGMDGLEVCRRIRQEPSLSDVRIVIVSGALTPDLEARFLQMGADRCLRKPIDPAALEEALARFLPAAEPQRVQVNG